NPTAAPPSVLGNSAVLLDSLPPPAAWRWPTYVPAPSAPPADWSALPATALDTIQAELDDLVLAASDERADALGEILSQADEFMSYLLNLLTARPGAYPATTRVLAIANLIATFAAMYFKGRYTRPRPSQLCPALLPPLEVPGHASFPSGHSTQAHLMVLCLSDVFAGVPGQTPAQSSLLPQRKGTIDDLWTLADRIARNREIAGLHYPSDSAAGVSIAWWLHNLMTVPSQGRYLATVAAAHAEWVG
ncbi:MAG: phosphatase PAP2 family protein, partial [Proteobacteria bacterium]|nr:phosphatase PAP2 family protein [Pseudomonadota bacterium]